MLVGEAPVRLDDLLARDVRLAFKGVNVLREACVEVRVVREELHEGVRERGAEAAWVVLAGECVDCRERKKIELCMMKDFRKDASIAFEDGNNEVKCSHACGFDRKYWMSNTANG